jgi:hypothetical protein
VLGRHESARSGRKDLKTAAPADVKRIAFRILNDERSSAVKPRFADATRFCMGRLLVSYSAYKYPAGSHSSDLSPRRSATGCYPRGLVLSSRRIPTKAYLSGRVRAARDIIDVLADVGTTLRDQYPKSSLTHDLAEKRKSSAAFSLYPDSLARGWTRRHCMNPSHAGVSSTMRWQACRRLRTPWHIHRTAGSAARSASRSWCHRRPGAPGSGAPAQR